MDKVCSICGAIKNEKDFYWHSATNRYCSECKECTKYRSKKYRIEHPDKIREMRNNYKERRKEIRYKNDRKSYLKYKYNISEDIYKEMYDYRNGCCDICKKHIEYRQLCVDHNHKTNKLRGMLCRNCNLALGSFKDNIQYLQEAIKYLERYDIGE